MSFSMPASPVITLFVYLFICLSVLYLSVCLSVCLLSVCLLVCCQVLGLLPVLVSMPIYLRVPSKWLLCLSPNCTFPAWSFQIPCSLGSVSQFAFSSTPSVLSPPSLITDPSVTWESFPRADMPNYSENVSVNIWTSWFYRHELRKKETHVRAVLPSYFVYQYVD